MMKSEKGTESVATQIRIPHELYCYVQAESKRLGLSMNAILIVLLDDGRRLRGAEIIVEPR